jgi:hypothetical protein
MVSAPEKTPAAKIMLLMDKPEAAGDFRFPEASFDGEV